MSVCSPAMPHVLVAEDEVLAAEAIEFFLSDIGFRVSLAGDGADALRIDEQDPADLLLTDLAMPRVNGIVLISQLRRRRPTLPIVVMTGCPPSGGIDVLCNGTPGRMVLVNKPFSVLRLTNALRETMPLA